MTDKMKNWRPATKMVHGGENRSQFGETSEALFLTQGFVYASAESAENRFNGDEDGYIYSRYANPTVSIFEERMCMLEGAEAALATASGMAAVAAAILCQVKAGDHIVAARALFGSCRYVVEKLAPQYGVECTLVDGKNLDEWKAAVRPNTKVMFFESPTNPTLELVDIKGVVALAKEIGATTVIDNVFATPMWQKPIELGIDVVAYSATKHIDGQGRCLGGIILSSQKWIDEVLFDYFRHTGPSMSPFNAWVLLKGLETLPIRVKAQTETTAKLVDAIADHKNVEQVIYPGHKDFPQNDLFKAQMKAGSTIFALRVKGGKAAAFKMINALEIFKISNNVGDAKSLVTHPATTTHKNLSDEDRVQVGICDGLLRFSIGLEDADDLSADLLNALNTI